MLRRLWLLGLILCIVVVLAGCGPKQTTPEPVGQDKTDKPADPAKPEPVEVDKHGGTLNIAWMTEADVLDLMSTTLVATRAISNHIFEPLVTFDADYGIIPMLAERVTTSPDGLVYTFHLRSGVNFHNGAQMTADDVVASLERWFTASSTGAALLNETKELRVVDGAVVLELENATGLVLTYLAETSQAAVIIPGEIARAAGKDLLTADQLVGTGPYKLGEWKSGQHIRLVRFDGYSSRTEEPNGYGGAKYAYLDEIVYHFIPDESTRLAGLQTGLYHYSENLSVDSVTVIRSDPGLQEIVVQPSVYPFIMFNKERFPGSDVNFRRAVAAALSMEPMLMASAGHQDFYELNGCPYTKSNRWYSEAGLDKYNQNDTAKARELLKQSGYDNQPVTLIIQTDMEGDYNLILTMRQQLENIGIQFDSVYTDFTTVSSIRRDPTAFDIWVGGAMTFRSDPSQLLLYSTRWPAPETGWINADAEKLMSQLRTEFDDVKRYQIWEEAQTMYWDQVPSIIVGHINRLGAVRVEVQDFVMLPERYFWNVWLKK